MDPNLRRSLLIGGLLTGATLAVYAQAVGFDFVKIDDGLYVTQNEVVQRGLTSRGVRWALTTGYGTSWTPLTWLSLMLDFELYGLDAAGYHATNVALHLLNALLLFAVFQSMTREPWPSAFVAALFALHPLHVESVAWVAERKDVLSTFFGLLSMAAYVRYARNGGRGAYLATAALLALGLMAKPMLVTLPLVFLLLDYWPLDRLRPAAGREAAEGPERARPAAGPASIGVLLAEKAPLLALAALSGLATWVVQVSGGAVASAGSLPLTLRASNAVVAYARYLGKAIWPSDLSYFYPYPVPAWGGAPLTGAQVAGALGLLVAISIGVVWSRRRYAVVGWLWYLGTLVPVIGLIQVGRQAMADRYTYLPLIGLFVIVAWSGSELAARLRQRPALRIAVGLVAVTVLVACAGRSWWQARLWRGSEPLFQRALALNPRDATTNFHLGTLLADRGETEEAIRHYRQALATHPRYADAHAALGIALQQEGRLDAAIARYREALAIEPDRVNTHFRLGNALRLRGDLDEAIAHYRRALELRPDFAEAGINLHFALKQRRDAAPR
jgi:tetratricopeptide (TPR) repeat protein